MCRVSFAAGLFVLALVTPLPAQGLPQPPAAAAPAEDGQWLVPAKNAAGTRYSGLDEITPENVKGLQVAFTFSTGVNRGQEAAPIIAGSTMYVLTPYPNILYALDLTRPGAPMKWSYQTQPAAAAQGVACCDTVNRGPTFANGRIYFNTLDASTVAVDAESGKEIWRTGLGSINSGETMTMAPLVAKDKVLVGNSGGEFGVRGFIAALDAASGQLAWRRTAPAPIARC